VKRAKRRHRAIETNQQGSGNLQDSSTGDLHFINAGRGAHNVIIARQQEREEVEAYSPTNYQLPLDYQETTRKLLSVKTHRRAATGNTRSREASGTAGGSRSLGQRPRSPAHALAW
jgi:hypothetical protein